MYSRIQQGTLRLSSERCGCIWPAWVGSYWPFIIFYCRGSPIVSGFMGQGHVCVPFCDVLTPHHMTDVLELETGEHLLKCSVERTDWTADESATGPWYHFLFNWDGGDENATQTTNISPCRQRSDTELRAHFQQFSFHCSDKSNNDSKGFMLCHSKPNVFWQHLCPFCLNWVFLVLFRKETSEVRN